MKTTYLALGSVFALLFLVLAQSCAKDEGKLAPVAIVDCDTVSYAQDIAPIITANCNVPSCHVAPNPSGSVYLDTYDAFKTQSVKGRIQARVIDGNPSFMPDGGELNPQQKAIISCWLANGYKP